MKNKIIFLGNGALAEAAYEVLCDSCEVVFWAKKKEDLDEVVRIRRENPEIKAVLASFGVLIPEGVLSEFEPEGILNIHPSLLPKYRGPSPIETAILNGDVDFGVSVMKLAKKMDAGPIYWQETVRDLPLDKDEIYRSLARTGAEWVVQNIANLPEPVAQNDAEATYTSKIEKKMGVLEPEKEPAEAILRKIVAFQGWPRAKYAFFGVNSAILEAKRVEMGSIPLLPIKCADGGVIEVLRLQPDGRKPMDAKAFLNGYRK